MCKFNHQALLNPSDVSLASSVIVLLYLFWVESFRESVNFLSCNSAALVVDKFFSLTFYYCISFIMRSWACLARCLRGACSRLGCWQHITEQLWQVLYDGSTGSISIPWPRHSLFLEASATISRYMNLVSTRVEARISGLFSRGSFTLNKVVRSTFRPCCLPKRSTDVCPAKKFLTYMWKSWRTGRANPADKMKIAAAIMWVSILLPFGDSLFPW